jgi:hypothetical protein
VVDPNQVGSGKGQSIPAPYILVVQVADLDVLDNDVLPAKLRPLPLMMPLAPIPRNVLLDPTLMDVFAAL